MLILFALLACGPGSRKQSEETVTEVCMVVDAGRKRCPDEKSVDRLDLHVTKTWCGGRVKKVLERDTPSPVIHYVSDSGWFDKPYDGVRDEVNSCCYTAEVTLVCEG